MLRAVLLAAALSLCVVSPAFAADVPAQAVDFSFVPKTLKVAPGDSVTWSFSGEYEHTSTSVKGQAESWSSGLQTAGGTYSHTFTKPGRFQYICLPHRFTMKGTVQVGDDPYSKSFGAVTTSGTTSRFGLLEAARVTAKLGKKRVYSARRDPGRVKVAWGKGLKAGSYKGTIVAVDDFDVTTSKTVRFTVR